MTTRPAQVPLAALVLLLAAGAARAEPAPSASGPLLPPQSITGPLQWPGEAPATPGPAAVPEPARQLVLDRKLRQLLVLENGRVRHRYPVAIGMPGWETPVGQFAVIAKTANPIWEHPVTGVKIKPGADNPLGSRWIGFHRDCRGRKGFNGLEQLEMKGCVVAGFHGTPNRASIGQAVSHGCVRLYDENVQELFDLVQIGTSVTVLP